MGQLGALAPFGLLEFGGEESVAEPIYRSMCASMAAYDLTPGTHVEATIYARALALGTVRATLRHARDQRRPMRAVEMLPALEDGFGIVPTLEETEDARRREVAARKLIMRGSSHPALAAALNVLLGSAFVGLKALGGTATPADPSTTGAWQDPSTPGRFFRLLTAVSAPDPLTETSFSYEALLADGADLQVGDVVSVDVDNSAINEAITVLSVAYAGAAKGATAKFSKAHSVGATARTHAPVWVSQQRRFVVVVTAAAAVDPNVRRRIDGFMQRAVRASTQWSIARSSGLNQIGPFTVGQSPIGAVPIGTVSIL